MSSGDNVDVGGLAAIINSRLASEARVAKAIGVCWLGGGAALAITLAGLGAAAAFYGYSFVVSSKAAADQIASAIADAMQRTDLKVSISGKMDLDPNSELRLARGQTVQLKEGTIVKLEPKSSVRVVGEIKIPQAVNVPASARR